MDTAHTDAVHTGAAHADALHTEAVPTAELDFRDATEDDIDTLVALIESAYRGDERFGIPRRDDLQFELLVKPLG